MNDREKGSRVGALLSLKGKTAKLFGFGVYDGRFDPETGEETLDVFGGNPRITLDDGRGYVWGFECWWGSEERIKEQIEGCTVELVTPHYNTATPLKTETA